MNLGFPMIRVDLNVTISNYEIGTHRVSCSSRHGALNHTSAVDNTGFEFFVGVHASSPRGQDGRRSALTDYFPEIKLKLSHYTLPDM